MTERYDVVIVGGGTAGCVLADRLSENPERSVTLIEAGRAWRRPADAPSDVSSESVYMPQTLWSYPSVGNHGVTHDITTVRGRVLGGSGSVNGMIFQRAPADDYDGWGFESWGSFALDKYIDRVVNRDGEEPEGRVPIRRLPRSEWSSVHRAFVDALVRAGVPVLDDLFHPTEDGVGPVYRNCTDGRRMSAALTYIAAAAERPNLTILSDSQVSRVVFDGTRATGVEMARGGDTQIIGADEVVLTCGAIETPHLMMLSGLGDAARLHAAGLEVARDIPAVGRNLTDHPAVLNIVQLRSTVSDWRMRFPVSWVSTSSTSSTQGDIHTIVASGPVSDPVAWSIPDHGETRPDPLEAMIVSMGYDTDAVGELELDPDDPLAPPLLRHRYLESERDRARFREHQRRLAEYLYSDNEFAGLLDNVDGIPAADVLASDERLDRWIADHLMTVYHACGTCRMGKPEDSVVDEKGRVHGVSHLRIADLSIVPKVPRSATNATAFVVAERIAEFMQTAD